MAKPIELTDQEINALSGEELRAVAKDYEIGSYATHRDIFTLTLTTDVVSNPRIMKAYGELLLVIQDANHRDPVIVEGNGYQVTVRAWQSDDSIRQSLISTRNYRAKQASAE